MSKDFIIITKDDGSTEQMEVVATFKLEETAKDCIIYKNANNQYFAASYKNDTDYSDLDTNFSDEEKEKIKIIFENIKNRGEDNA